MNRPVPAQPPPGSGLTLRWRQDQLELSEVEPSATGIAVDFLRGALARRRVGIRRATHSLSRAVGRKAPLPEVVDGTAGLGRDAFVLACLGYQVQAFERCPVLHALLADGLRRWQASEDPAAARLTLHHGDVNDGLVNRSTEVVYLDPMFPSRRKSAQVKKEMQLLQRLSAETKPGQAADQMQDQTQDQTAEAVERETEALFAMARDRATQRVVLKRPAHAPTLAPPNFQVSGSAVRWDVYLC